VPAPRLTAARATAVAVIGLVLGLVALIFDASPLFVPAVALTALGVLTPAWVWLAARDASARRLLTAERVVEDQPLVATIEVQRGWLGLPGAEVVDPFTDMRFEMAERMSPLHGGRRASVRVVIRFTRRGLHRLPAPTLTVSDPLDLARAQTESTAVVQELLVLPATEPVRWLRPDHGRRLKLPDGSDGSEAMAAVDIDGLRPYRPGTPASRIHWPAVARGAGLIERRLRADGDSRPLIVLDARTPADAGPELLDAAVRAAASLALDLARHGGCGLLLPGEQRATTIDRELATWPAAHARLAVVEPAAGGHAQRPPALRATAQRQGPMIYVAAWPVERLGALLASPTSGPAVLVVPDEALVGGRPPGIRTLMRPTLAVSGCQGFLLGAGREVDRLKPQQTAA
jgi:uncharacterized protein (DUF58 family)